MRLKFILISFFATTFFLKTDAQKFRYNIPGLDTLQESFIVSGAASAVLRQGQAEVIFNNSLVSYWIAFHENGKNSPILDRLRNSLFMSELSGYYGISTSGRFDVGLQAGYARTRLANSASSSPLRVFRK